MLYSSYDFIEIPAKGNSSMLILLIEGFLSKTAFL